MCFKRLCWYVVFPHWRHFCFELWQPQGEYWRLSLLQARNQTAHDGICDVRKQLQLDLLHFEIILKLWPEEGSGKTPETSSIYYYCFFLITVQTTILFFNVCHNVWRALYWLGRHLLVLTWHQGWLLLVYSGAMPFPQLNECNQSVLINVCEEHKDVTAIIGVTCDNNFWFLWRIVDVFQSQEKKWFA